MILRSGFSYDIDNEKPKYKVFPFFIYEFSNYCNLGIQINRFGYNNGIGQRFKTKRS